MSGVQDSRGYYQALGLTPGASAEEIKQAYRRKAKELHPDRNRSAGATAAFQAVSEAYRVLGDAEARARYDTLGATDTVGKAAGKSDEGPQTVDPIVCSACGAVTAQPRYVIFWQVMSFLLVTLKRPVQGVFCRACADEKAFGASLTTWLLGWWGFPWGPIWSIAALFKNLSGGTKPADANAAILGQQAAHFASTDKLEFARAALDEALRFARSPELREKLSLFQRTLGENSVRLRVKDRWRPAATGMFYVQLVPILGAAAFMISLVTDAQDWRRLMTRLGVDGAPRTVTYMPTATYTPPIEPIPTASPPSSGEIAASTLQDAAAQITLAEPAAGLADHAKVATDTLNLRVGPGTTYPVLETLSRGTVVTVFGDLTGAWVKIQSPTGRIGYVAGKYLTGQERLATDADVGPGTAVQSTAPTCIESVGLRTGAVIEQLARGPHTLRINNGTDQDAVVKLKRTDGRTVLAFYVGAHQTASVATVPDGSYRVVFASGRRWSKNCGRFLEDMRAMQFDRTDNFQRRVEGNYEYYNVVTYTLHRVTGGNAAASTLPVEAF